MSEDTSLYVIELEPEKDMNAKWYVGISSEPKKRFQTHKAGRGAVWTRRNSPTEMYVVDSGPRAHMRALEDHLTALLMDEYGRDTTRGGGCTASDPVTYPNCGEGYVDPELARGLGETGNAELARFADRAALFCEVHIEEQHSSYSELHEWADNHLPTGTKVVLEVPGLGEGKYVSKEPEPGE